jgi:glycopeptide antibiotics resistance protein
MVMPRKLPYEQFSPLHSNFIKRAFHQILYYGGPLEPVANFFVLIPAFAILLTFLGRSRAVWGVAICIALSATAESLQQFIPGRVSSFRDFALNSAGAISAYLLYTFYTRSKTTL